MAATVESLTVKYDSNVAQGAAADTRAMDVLDQRVTRTTKSVDTLNRSLSGEAAELAKTEAANRKAAQAIAAYDAALAKGTITVEAHGEAVRRVGIIREQDIARAKEQAAALESRFTQQTATTQRLTSATGNASYAVKQLGIQSIDVFQQLASGAPVMTTFIQQGGQITQVAAQGGVSFGQLARGVGSFVASINPFLLLGVAATGAIVGFGAAAESSSRQLNALQNQLRATRSDYEALAAGVVSASKAVAASSGASTADARAAGLAIAGAANFSGSQARLQDLIRTANDLAAVMGKTLPEAAKDLASALEDPGASAKRLADQHFPAMSQALAYAIKLQSDAGDKAGAFGRVLDAMQAQTKGAADNLTPMQKALRDLSEAFTKTGQDGRSLADAIGGAITSATAVALNGLTGLVKGIEDIRQRLMSGPQGIPAAGGYAGTTGQVLTSSAGAMGIFQLMPGTAAQYSVNPSDPTQNILGGLSYIRDLYGSTGGNINELLRQYGGFKTKDPSAYIASVNNADTSGLNGRNVLIGSQTMTVAQAIEFWGQSLGLSPDVIALGKRIATVESGGRQFASAGGAEGTSAGPTGGLNIVNTELTGASASLSNYQYRQGLRNDAYAAALAAGGLSTQQEANRATQAKLQAGLAVTSDPAEVAKLTEALAKLRGEEAGLITEQEKMARSAVDATRALSEQAGFSRTMAEIEAKYAIAARDSGRAIDEQSLAREKAAAQVKLSTDYQDAIRATELQTEAIKRVSAAYDGTAISIEKATNWEKAYAEARKDLDEKSPDFTRRVQEYANALDQSTAASRALQQAQSSVQAVMDSLSNVADRLGQGLVDAFLSGQGAAVNFANIAKAALSSLAADFLKLAALNPLKNSLLGGNLPTLSSAFGVLGNGSADNTGASGGIMGSLGNLSTGVGITDALGLTNIKSMIGGLGETLGITGQGGLLSGLNSILATPLWSTGLGAVPLEGAYSAAQVAASGATTSLGGLLGGAGLGFGAGTLLNSLLGGKTIGGTAGSGVGSLAGAALGSIIPGVGTILGGLLGGVLGGAGGGLIGPNAPNAYSSTGVSLSGGQLSLGATISQLVDTTQEVANATAQMAQINSFLAQQGISISSLGSLGQIGQNTPGKAADPTKFADLSSAFSQLRFTSEDATKAAQIADKSFGSITELAQTLQDVATKSAQTTDLLDNVIPTLTKANDNVGSVAQQMAALAQPYNQAFTSIQAALAQAQTPEMTARLSQGATDIVTALDAAYGRAWDGIRKQIDASDQALAVRYAQASANASGDKGQMRDAALMAFDYQAQQARTAYADQLTGLFGDAYAQTADYAARLAALDRTTAQERLAVAKQYAEDVVAVDQTAARQQAAQSALGVITSLSDYSRSLTYGSDSPLSPTSQYEMAQRDFQAVAGAARAGDFNSISKLSGYADTFLRASRTVNGSGIAYANDFAAVQDTIKGVASQSVESIIASAMAANVAASEAIAQKQDTTNDLLSRVLIELQQVNLKPAA